MALTEEDKMEIQRYLEQENAQNRNKILSSAESLHKWLKVFLGIFTTLKDIIGILGYFRSLLL